MHELSIALEVCRLAEEKLGREALRRVVSVGVDVGEDAGVEIGALEFCLGAVLAEPPFGRARAVIRCRPGDVLQVSYLELEDDGDPDH